MCCKFLDWFIGRSKIRLAQNGDPLPSPRLIRTTLLPDGDDPDPELTLGVVAWGQMIAHDVALRTLIPQDNGYFINLTFKSHKIRNFE